MRQEDVTWEAPDCSRTVSNFFQTCDLKEAGMEHLWVATTRHTRPFVLLSLTHSLDHRPDKTLHVGGGARLASELRRGYRLGVPRTRVSSSSSALH